MRIPDINRLGKCDDLLERVVNNLEKVVMNLCKQGLEKTETCEDVQRYAHEALELQCAIKGIERDEYAKLPAEEIKKYDNKFL